MGNSQETPQEPAPPSAKTAESPAEACGVGIAAVTDGVGYPSVAEAVDAAVQGGTVEVCPGTWPANLILGTDVELRGAGDGYSTLDGGHLDHVVFIPTGVDVALADLTLSNGDADEGGGLFVNGVVEATRVGVEGNSAGYGGGVYVEAGTLTLLESAVRDNLASESGGGIFVGGGALLVRESSISGNHARSAGGLAAYGGETELADVSFYANVAGAGSGGGASVTAYASMTDVRFTANVALDGGALSGTDRELSGVVATGNRALHGGGLYLDGGSAIDLLLEDNLAVSGGGAYLVDAALGPGVRVLHNTAAFGGGVAARGATLVEVELADNRAVDGGALGSSDDAALEAGSVVRNLADRGGGAWLSYGSLVSSETDWGAGEDDNVPDDVAGEDWSATGWDANASFTCGADLMGCE